MMSFLKGFEKKAKKKLQLTRNFSYIAHLHDSK